MIKNIVFDMGQVLIHWWPKELVARLGLGDEDSRLLLAEVFGGAEWIAMDRGRFTAEEGLRPICARLPERLHPAAESLVNDWWKGEFWPVEGMEELTRELYGMGYRLYLLSNAASTLNIYFDRIPGSQYFSGKLVSADVKLLKPQHEIFELMYERFSLAPEDCLFIDDNPENIDGAACTGMDGIVFREDMARLRRELREKGIDVKQS